MELNRSLGIVVGDGEDLPADRAPDGQFFLQLARQTRGERFARQAFAAGELPIALEVNPFVPAGYEEPSIALDHRGRYDDRFRHTHPLDIGQTRHLGLRATQTMAPKSINA